MLEVQMARGAMFDALKAMADRFEATPDAAERTVITDSMDRLNGLIGQLALEDLLQSANAVADATTAVQSAVAAAKKGPFSGYLTALERIMGQLDDSIGAIHATKSLAPAPSSAASPTMTTAEAKPFVTGAADAALGPPSKNTSFDKLRDEYDRWFAACALRPGHEGEVAFFLKMLRSGKENYEKAGDAVKVPWHVVAIIHGLEGGFNFGTHLHNGDPLSARTVQVPAGRPKAGSPPFTWVASAIDALRFEGLADVTDWSIAHTLFRFESFNGMGYRSIGVPTPYLWSGSNLYNKGKFVKDHVFDPEKVSQQVGAGLILKTLVNNGVVTPSA
jgi:lysozyme family protein